LNLIEVILAQGSLSKQRGNHSIASIRCMILPTCHFVEGKRNGTSFAKPNLPSAIACERLCAGTKQYRLDHQSRRSTSQWL
jgi:hypothetical protein